jgi:GAF domain
MSTASPPPATFAGARPDRVATIRRPGRVPHQVLAFGSGVLAGWGLQSHEAGLPGALADALHAGSGRGVDLTVIVDSEPTAERTLEALPGLRLRRFDAIVVMLGEDPAAALMRPAAWQHAVARLLEALISHVDTGRRVFVHDSSRAMLANSPGIPARMWRSAARLSAVTERTSTRAGARFAELAPSLHRIGVGGRFSPTDYSAWADQITDRIRLALLDLDEWVAPGSSRSYRDSAADEELRQAALDSMRLERGASDDLIDAIVRRARAVFAADGAALNIIDGDEQWQLATTRAAATTLPRRDGFCDVTIASDGLTLINDVQRDPRVAGRRLAKGARFYAGVPIHTWDGYRIGTLCIYDRSPRSMHESDLAELHELAGRVEQELWTEALRRG